MSTETVITIDHVRAVGLCVNGTRTWFARHDLDFRGFLRDGLDADTLLATGDAMARRVVDYAQAHASQQRIQREQD
jgi:hypothetical protein